MNFLLLKIDLKENFVKFPLLNKPCINFTYPATPFQALVSFLNFN